MKLHIVSHEVLYCFKKNFVLFYMKFLFFLMFRFIFLEKRIVFNEYT